MNEEQKEEYFNTLQDWMHRIHMATITMKDEAITKVISEIKSFSWLSEGEDIEDKLNRRISTKVHATQDPKYGIRNNRLVNIRSGEDIPEDEPVFLMRAKDVLATSGMRGYRILVKNHCHSDDGAHLEAIDRRINEFRDFSTSNEGLMHLPTTERAD